MSTGPRGRLKARRLAMRPYVSLEEMGRRCDVTDSTVDRWETGENDPWPRHWANIAGGYQWPLEHLPWLLERDDEHQDRREPNLLVAWHHDDVDRRDFLAGSAAFVAAGALPGGERAAIGATEVGAVDAAIEAMERHDATVGGGSAYGEAVRLRGQVERWLDTSTYRPSVGDQLQSQLGALSSWAGWLAFDAGRYELAQSHLQDALTQARVTDDPALEARALAAMCLTYNRQNRPRMAFKCAETGLRAAAGWATPRHLALLHMRRAYAAARLGDRSGFRRDVAHAAKELDRGPHPDDPLHIHFVSEQELGSMTGRAWLSLGEPDRAVAELRAINDASSARPRNVTLTTVTLARSIAATGDIAEASTIGAGLVDTVASLHSGRTAADLALFRRSVEGYQSTVAAARDFAERYDTAFAVA